jgi:hypothetical protein
MQHRWRYAIAAVARRNAVSADLQALRNLVGSLNYSPDAAILERFAARFEEYQQLDDQILPLAVANTNLKAQRLSYVQALAQHDFRATR